MSKTCLKWPLKKEHQKLFFNTDYRLMQVKSIAECSNGSILQYFRPSLSYHFPLRSWFCLFLSGCLRQVLLYPSYYILLWDKEIPPEDQNNSSETRLCQEVNFHLTNEYVLICAQALQRLHNVGLDARKPVFRGLGTAKAQTTLRNHAVWSAPLLFTYWKVLYLDWL